MASVIEATVGHASANSYATLAEATTYFGDRLHKDAWGNAGASEKTAALLWACRVIDGRMDWAGSRASDTQALAWPRLYAPDPDPPYLPSIQQIMGRSLAEFLPGDIVPTDIKNAQFELALALLSGDLTAEPGATGLNSLAVGSLRLDFAGNTQQPKTFPRQVEEILSKYGTVRATRTANRKLLRS